MGSECACLRRCHRTRLERHGSRSTGDARQRLDRGATLPYGRGSRSAKKTKIGDGMDVTPREQEWLLIYVAADVARKRSARGLDLNYSEAIDTRISDILEW